MFCTKCGAQVKDGNTFCTVCGERVENISDNSENYSKEQNISYMPKNQPRRLKNKCNKKKVLIPAIAAGVVAAGAVVSFASPSAKTFWVKMFNSPEGYFQYVMEKNTKDVAGRVSSLTESYKDALAMQYDADIKLTVDDKVKELIGSIDDEAEDYIGWIENVGIGYSTALKDDKLAVDFKANLNGVNLGKIEYILDNDEGVQYVGVPEASDTYLCFSDGMPEIAIKNLSGIVPEKAVVEKLLCKYSECVADEINNVNESSDEISANGVEQKVTRLTAKVNEETAVNVAKEVLKEFKSDKDCEKIIKNLVKTVGAGHESPEDVYDYLIENVDYTLDELNDVEDFDKESIKIDFYVNSKSELVGIELGDEEMGIAYYTTKKGSNYGTSLELNFGNEGGMTIEGGGKIKGVKQSGDYEVKIVFDSYSDMEMKFNISVSDMDVDLLEKGVFNGKMEFSLPKDMIEEALEEADVPSIVASLMNKISFVIDSKTTNNSNPKTAIELKAGDETLIKLDCNMKYNSDKKVTIPDNYIDTDDDYYEYSDELDEFLEDVFDYLAEKLEDADAPDELIDELEDEMIYY